MFAPTDAQQQNPQNQQKRDIDYAGYEDHKAEMLGVDPNLQGEQVLSLMGTITTLYDLGVQERPEQFVEWDAKAQQSHSWRLEMNDAGDAQKDPSAYLGTKKIKGKEVEVLFYTPNPVTQVTMTVDFPEVMINTGKFFGNEDNFKPFREVLGGKWFRVVKGGNDDGSDKRVNIINKPINFVHTDVNRQAREKNPNLESHYAFAKNSTAYKIAQAAGVLDAEGNFHKEDFDKLLNKTILWNVKVKWNRWTDASGNAKKQLVTEIVPQGQVPAIMQKAFDAEYKQLLDDVPRGFILVDKENDLKLVSQLRADVKSMIGLAKNYENSPLSKQIEGLANGTLKVKSNSSDNQPNSKPDEQTQGTETPKQATAQQAPASGGVDFDQDIPFAPIGLQEGQSYLMVI